MHPANKPPRFATYLLHLFLPAHRAEELEGDLDELFQQRIRELGLQQARWRYVRDVVSLMRPSLIRRDKACLVSTTTTTNSFPKPAFTTMIRSYLKIAFRNLTKNKAYSAINIGGLSIGMGVAMLIGLWVYDELSFDKTIPKYDRIAQIRRVATEPTTGISRGTDACQIPLATVLKAKYGQYFKHILIGFWPGNYTVADGQKKYTQKGRFIEAGVIDMLSLQMVNGSQTALDDPHSIILSTSASKAIFGQTDPVGKRLKLDNRMDVTVMGVYADLPKNSTYGDLQFFAPWALWVSSNDWVKDSETDWGRSSFPIDVQIADNTSMETVDAAINDFYQKNAPSDLVADARDYKLEMYLYPMRQWHLYSEFTDGRPSGGRITFVWLFGIVGGFVLLLACINFMNLSTARSEKRAKEVGIRKAVGSVKSQLVNQFLSESFLVVSLAFAGSLGLVLLSLPWFNELADKAIVFPWQMPSFWLASVLFLTITALLAGLYPAFYLSSFQPVKVLKGTLRMGRLASLPRKVLVVVQFTVSVVLIIGVLLVYKQIQYVKNRPVGYERTGLLSIPMNDPNYKGKEEVLERELMATGMVGQVAYSSSPLTSIWNNIGGFEWDNKPSKAESGFAVMDISTNFGTMAGWQFVAGRDFSKAFVTDSTAVIINETAARYLGLKKRNGQWVVGAYIRQPDFHWKRQIIGVIKDMVMDSPFEPVKRSFYFLDAHYAAAARLNLRLKPTVSAQDALPRIESVIRKTVPSALFTYSFVDQDFAAKFSTEQRIGKLASVFAVLAIFISCLGIFGLASFVAEQRTKEIGVRKVLGASVLNLWGLLSRDFIVLVIIAFSIATPIAYYTLTNWLQKYAYRTELSWWIFVAAGSGALLITLLTVSFQSIKAALMNPVKSLRSE
ncbi:ABC transporter permease [Spirosoma gilvum]